MHHIKKVAVGAVGALASLFMAAAPAAAAAGTGADVLGCHNTVVVDHADGWVYAYGVMTCSGSGRSWKLNPNVGLFANNGKDGIVDAMGACSWTDKCITPTVRMREVPGWKYTANNSGTIEGWFLPDETIAHATLYGRDPLPSAVTASAHGSKAHVEVVRDDTGMWNTDADYTSDWSRTWSPMGGGALTELTSVMTGNVMHVFAIGQGGKVFSRDADYDSGRWTDWVEVPGGAAGATALSAAAYGNSVHLQIIGADGGLWNTDADYAAGRWSGQWGKLGGTQLTSVSSAMVGNVMHVYAVGQGGAVLTRDADYNRGTWTNWSEVPGGALGAKAVSAAAIDSTVHLQIIGADGGLWNTDADYAAGRWSGRWGSLGGSQLTSLTSIPMGNTVRVYALDEEGTALNKDGNYTTGQWSTWAPIP